MFQQPEIYRITMTIEHADGVDHVEVTGRMRVRIEEGDMARREEMEWRGTSFIPRRWDLHFENIEHLRVEPLPVVELHHGNSGK